jgi:F-type H+-transporting ATPase subunit delta
MAKKLDAQQVAVARVYALALLELARTNHQEELVLEELEVMLEHFDRQPRFEQILVDPAVDEGERAGVLERVLRDRANDLVVNTLQVMNRKGRMALIRHLVEAYREELAKLGNVVDATATTAVPLKAETRRRLVEALTRFTGKKVLLAESIDVSLIGGMILRLGDRKIDSSVARELWRVGNRLHERASEHLQTAAMMER